ncbi:MAG: hypothetical protein MZW92_62885 [Comamonadaceae bacterium]|nr:hypothetical protein [Comamonadaceae bacterium]
MRVRPSPPGRRSPRQSDERPRAARSAAAVPAADGAVSRRTLLALKVFEARYLDLVGALPARAARRSASSACSQGARGRAVARRRPHRARRRAGADRRGRCRAAAALLHVRCTGDAAFPPRRRRDAAGRRPVDLSASS